jgi:hypothetical protein
MSHGEVTIRALLARHAAERVEAVRRGGDAHITGEQYADASRLLLALLQAAEPFGVTLADFDWVVDLPSACLDVTLAKNRRDTS